MKFMDNQYIVLKKNRCDHLTDNVENIYDIHSFIWGDYIVYKSVRIESEARTSGEYRFLILGYIIDPFNPYKDNKNILDDVINEIDNLDFLLSFERCVLKYSGRFVFFIHGPDGLWILNDACGLRQVFIFDDSVFGKIFTSNPDMIVRMISKPVNLDEDILVYINSNKFKKHESQWFGYSWYDKNVKKLLPNHIYCESKNQFVRMNCFDYSNMEYSEVIRISSNIIKGSIQGVHNRYKVFQPITSGYDSRVILAGSKDFCESTKYYIFNRKKNKADIRISEKISRAMNLDFHVINTEKIDKNFLDFFSSLFLFPRVLPKTANIQWHYKNNKGANVININGNGGEIVRMYFPIDKKNRQEEIKYLLSLTMKPKLFEKDIVEWYDKAIAWVTQGNITINDLFYWEQRMGHWGAAFPLEQDIAVEEFSPFSNRYLLLLLLSRKVEFRKAPNYQVTKDLIENMWEELLKFEFNPLVGISLYKKIYKFIKMHPVLYRCIKKILVKT